MAHKDDPPDARPGDASPGPGLSHRQQRIAEASDRMMQAYRRIEEELPAVPGPSATDRILEQRHRLAELRAQARALSGAEASDFRGEEHPVHDARHRAGVAASPQPSGAVSPEPGIPGLHRLDAALSAIRHSAVETCFYNLRLFAGLLAEGDPSPGLREKTNRAVATLPEALDRIQQFIDREMGNGLSIASAFPAATVQLRAHLEALRRAAQSWDSLSDSAPATDLSALARDLGEGVEQTTSALARMQAQLDARRIDLAELIESALSAESERLTAAGIAIQRGAMNAAGARLFLDRPVTLDALAELLRNAVRHGFTADTSPEGRKILIDLDYSDASRRAVRLTIADNGRGLGDNLPEELMARGVSMAGGTGEGLALVQSIAKAQLGRFELAPNTPRGACCTLTFPIKADLDSST